jgi:putative colanic acid biosynthesis acetyltransferase WcaF
MKLFFIIRRFLYIILINLINIILYIAPFNFLRLCAMRLSGVRLGCGVRVGRGVRLDFPWRLRVGSNCCIGPSVYLDCRGGAIVIGANSDISEGALLYTLSHDIQSDDFCIKKGEVLIDGRNWICARAVVLPGSRLGLGSVLSVNSVFSGSAGEFELLVGNPAVSVKKLSEARAARVRK